MVRPQVACIFLILIIGALLLENTCKGQTATGATVETLKVQGQRPSIVPLRQFEPKLLTSNRLELDEINEKLSAASMRGDTIAVLELKLRKSQVLHAYGNSAEALRIATQVYSSLESSEMLKFESTVLLRNIYYALDAYQKAIEFHDKIDWTNQSDHWESEVPDNFRAKIYVRIGDLDRGIRIMRRSILRMREKGFPYWELSFSNNLGVVYENQNQLDSAWSFFSNAHRILEDNFEAGEGDIDYDFVSGLVLGNMAQVLAKQGEHLKAIPLYKWDIQNSLTEPITAEKQINAIRSQLDLARSYVATEQFESAGKLIRNVHHEILAYQLDDALLEYWHLKWKLCERKGDWEMALIAANTHLELRDSLELAKSLKSLQNAQIAHESVRKESELRVKDRELEKLRSESDENVFMRNLSIGVGILMLTLIVIILLAINSKSQADSSLEEKTRKIEEQSRIISKSLEEKDLLLREIHHRVKNNLQIISSLFFLQSKKIEDEKAKNIIREGQSRVHVMSLIHQKLYQAEHLNRIEFQGYLSDLAKQILQTNRSPGLQINLTVNARDVVETVELAVPIGMIANELMTNSIKHAFEGRKVGHISLMLRRTGSQIALIYEDDGRGLDAIESLNNDDSLGMKLIRLLTNQLDGVMEFSGENGFKISIEFEYK